MPEFYNRFQGRSDLMEYAKVRRSPQRHPALAYGPGDTSLLGCLGQQPCLGGGTSVLAVPPTTTAPVAWASPRAVPSLPHASARGLRAPSASDSPATSAVRVTQGTAWGMSSPFSAPQLPGC